MRSVRRLTTAATVFLVALLLPRTLPAQQLAEDDPVLRAIWQQGMESSELEPLGQTLLDSLGPRLTGTPEAAAARRWAVSVLQGWGVDAEEQQYGTWKGWERGTTHADLVAPRVRSLNAMLMAWSPGTKKAVEGGVVVFPELDGKAAFEAWLPSVKGKFVALAEPLSSCRPLESYEEYGPKPGGGFMRAAPEGSPLADEVRAERRASAQAWRARIEATETEPQEMLDAIEKAGALGVLWSDWTGGWGARRVFALNTRFGATTRTIPAVDMSCEDYGLITRLAMHDQGPRLRVDARARFTGEAPAANVIGVLRGSERPDEYVLLSAHFDSWDGGSGATDNGTGSLTMLEAMRILSEAYPQPKRSILIGLWDSEEEGLNGSRAFAHDHPEIVSNLQAVYNQDNGTGRIIRASAMGLMGASEHLAKWLARAPEELTRDIDVSLPGMPSGGGSDHASFICALAPTFGLGSGSWDYFTYTWHTQLDTYDKVVWSEVRKNATLVASLAYLASEDTEVPADPRVMPTDPETGEPRPWPSCEDADRTTSERYQ